MDSLTQIVLGAGLAAAIAPPGHRRAALLAGAALGTLPDLDTLVVNALTDDPIYRMTWHRTASHSLFVLPFLATAIWAGFRSRGGRVAASPVRWFWAILLALITHPLLDAFTVYGTQLLWPLRPPPTMWSSVFIIDPMYTIWLLLACVAAWWLRARAVAQRLLVGALVLSTGYLAWSLVAKAMVGRDADRALAAMGLADAPRFSVPMPLNTLLWRVVAMTPDGYVEGFRSLAADRGPMRFTAYPSDVVAMRTTRDMPSVAELAWFNHGFMRVRDVDGALHMADLRMGNEPTYFFEFVVAQRDGAAWRAVPPRQVERQRDVGALWESTWRRIWHMPDAQAATDSPASASGTPAISASK